MVDELPASSCLASPVSELGGGGEGDLAPGEGLLELLGGCFNPVACDSFMEEELLVQGADVTSGGAFPSPRVRAVNYDYAMVRFNLLLLYICVCVYVCIYIYIFIYNIKSECIY